MSTAATPGPVRPWRFGVNLFAAQDAREWTATARQVEQLGYDLLLVADHLGYPSPFPLLTAAGSVTERVRLGTFVLNAGFWNPALLARDVATTDRLVDGRLEVGLGTGYARDEFATAGIDFLPAGRRVDHLDRVVAGLREHLYPEDGFRPLQAAVPLLLAGNGDRVLTLAARHADIVGFTGASTDSSGQMSLSGADALNERVAFARQAAGDRADTIEWNLLIQSVVVTDDVDAGLESERTRVAPHLSLDDVAAAPTVLVGSAATIADELRDLRARTGISSITVLQPALETFAPVIAELRGDLSA